MSVCLAPHCARPTQLYLCNDCITQLAEMLRQIPFLVEELDTRIQKLDRIQLGTIGRTRRPDELNVIDFDAAETARKLRKELVHWVTTVAERHSGRKPPGLATIRTADLARWLAHNVHAIATLNIAGDLYRDIKRRVGVDQRGGQLVQAINRTARHFAGPCPTILGHHGNTEIACGEILYADTEDRTVVCPKCKQTIDVEKNQRRAAAERDLRTRDELLEVLNNIGEKIPAKTLDAWIKARRLRRAGWLHNGQMIKFRINRNDPAVYSVARARKLRARDQQLRDEGRTRSESSA